MLLNKTSLEVAALFASKDDSRPVLNGILIEADGRTIGTDGHMLGIVSSHAMPDADFPLVPGMDTAQLPALTPCVLSADGIREVVKALPKRAHMPILSYALLDTGAANANGSAVFHTTDLDTARATSVKKLLDGNFPNWAQVVPKDAPVYRVCIDAHLLKRLAEAAIKMTSKKGAVPVELEFFANALGPMKATVDGENGQTLTAVVMPLRGKLGNDAYGLLQATTETRTV